jgi:hypothetical protein
MLRDPLSVELPVCPTCSHVSKIPAGLFSGKGFCSGPKEYPHKRVRMVPRTFAEVLGDLPVEDTHRRLERAA